MLMSGHGKSIELSLQVTLYTFAVVMGSDQEIVNDEETRCFELLLKELIVSMIL